MPNSAHLRLVDDRQGTSLSERADDELMLLVQAGRSDALGELLARHDARLASYCGKFLGDFRAVEEVAQETWLRIWMSRATYRAEGKFVVLLFTTARNACRNHARSLRRRWHWLKPAPLDEALTDVFDARDDQLDVLIERERGREVSRALLDLPAPMREALLLRLEEELSYDDIAAIVGANASTVRSRVHYGMKELRRVLSKGATQ